MRRPSRTGLPWMFVLCANLPLAAQNLEAIGRETPLAISGGVSINQIFYSSGGIAARRDPYSYFASGSVNFLLYGWSVPLTFSVTNHNTSFTQPFNQYSLHPTWKWVTLHAGYTSLSWSPYSVNGHIFSGAGIELAPEGKFRFSALYGRFLKPIKPDSSARNLPSYQRMGYGMKVSHGSDGNSLDLIFFRAIDDENSIEAPPDSSGVTPHENLVLSIGGTRRILKKFFLRGELASSAVTRDVRAEKIYSDHPLAKSAILFQPRLSSSYHQAFKSSLDYQHNDWVIGVGYERIDPEYRTLGAYYFNNDLENVTLNTSAGLADGKLRLAVSAGIQRNNLHETKVSTMRRLVSALNITFAPSPRLNLSGSWSSFQTHTHVRPGFESINQLTPYDNLDTLNFTQISRNASLSGMYDLGGAEAKRQNLTINISWQQAADITDGVKEYSGTRFYNVNAGYAINFLSQQTGIAVTLNSTLNDGAFINTRIMGPTASITKSLLKRRLRTTFSSSWNKTYSNGVNISSVTNARLNLAMTLRNKHNVHLSAVVADRTVTENKSVTEFTSTIGYNYSFSSKRTRP